jgi:hypothetical protein
LSSSIASHRVGLHGKFRPNVLLLTAYAALRRGISSKIATRNTDNGSGLGTQCWVIGRTISWLHNHRRLADMMTARADIHEAFPTIGCPLICERHLKTDPSLILLEPLSASRGRCAAMARS